MNLTLILLFVQVLFGALIGTYFWTQLRNQKHARSAVDKEAKKELDKLRKMRSIALTQPLAEKTRPTSLQDIVGQEEGLRALRAALCGPNPQHVLIYGPPGVGKTAAARVALAEAKQNSQSPFKMDAKFIEVDATTARFDERGIADPLLGSVHDPIYQGAGAMGVAGIPQPKPGAVTKAHGGVLFIDEIGELHPTQMNKLLKVLEDRKVFLESSYYNAEDMNIPLHIHDIFQNGLPADFRLVGATTRLPHELPPALRSRCMEIYFRPLRPDEIGHISERALTKIGFPNSEAAVKVIERYATNGREAVNIIQLATSIAISEQRPTVTAEDVEWVVNSSQIAPRPETKITPFPKVGIVNGLAVYGPNMGSLLEIEVTAIAVLPGTGIFNITGVVDEEELGAGGAKTLRRKSMAKSSVENVLTVLRKRGLTPQNYDIHINFPGGVPMDGPSAGISIATAVVSAMEGIPIDHKLAMTGEVSIHGQVKPVGGVVAKVMAAEQAGATKVIIPKSNWLDMFRERDAIEVIPVDSLEEVLHIAFGGQWVHKERSSMPVTDTIKPAAYMQVKTTSANREG